MIVIDASAALSGLLTAGRARELLVDEQLHAPHLIDSEVAQMLRRQVAAHLIPAAAGGRALAAWQGMGLIRYGIHGLLGRIWALRDNLSAYDAGYVALAEALECPLVTADARMSRAPGIRCAVTVIPPR